MSKRISIPGGAQLLGERIASARRKVGKTQAELAEEIGVDRSVISKLEGGRFETFSQSVQKICTFLGVDPRNPGDALLEDVLRRLAILSVKAPQLAPAMDRLLDVLEAANDRAAPPK